MNDTNNHTQNTDNAVIDSQPADTDSDNIMSSAPPVETTPVPSPIADDSARNNNNDLLDIKQKALQQLQPLISHLDQTPEEKFKTTMMMIQASDDKSLLPDAYQTAQSIIDEKARAEALLDIVNEINYFAQK